jgi:hypothetical protein
MPLRVLSSSRPGARRGPSGSRAATVSCVRCQSAASVVCVVHQRRGPRGQVARSCYRFCKRNARGSRSARSGESAHMTARIFRRVALAALVIATITLAAVRAAPAAAGNPAGCAMYLDHSHRSGHDPGHVKAVVRFSCKKRVTMDIAAGLWRHRWYGWQQMATNSKTFTTQRSGSLPVNARCPKGTYTWYSNAFSAYRWGNTRWLSYGASARQRFACNSHAYAQPAPTFHAARPFAPYPSGSPPPGETPSDPPSGASITSSRGGPYGCSNGCYALDIAVHNFPTGTYTYYCHDNSGPGGSDTVFYSNSVSVTDPNQSSWPGVFCYDSAPYTAYVTINGVSSNSVGF